MFWTKKISKTAKYTIIKNYGQLKGEGGRRKGPPKYATGCHCQLFSNNR